MPWFATSDHNEQLFAKLRTGVHCGRQTQLDPKRIAISMGKFNRLLETEKFLDLNGDLDDSLKLTTAHTRGKTLFPKRWNKHQDKGEIVEQGSTIKMNKLLDSMKRG